MKRYLIAILFVLLALPAYAEEPVQLAWMDPTMLGSGGSAVASQFCSDATHTTQNPSTAVSFCEDFDSDQSCYSGYSSNCRSAFTTVDAPPVFNYTEAPIAGTYSLSLPNTELADAAKDIGPPGDALYAHWSGKYTLAATPAERQIVMIENRYCLIKTDYTLKASDGIKSASSTLAITSGARTYFWAGADVSGMLYCCWSSTTTKPNYTTDTEHCGYISDSAVTQTLDTVKFTNHSATNPFALNVVDNIVINTSEIGNNP